VVTVHWQGELIFKADTPTGSSLMMDAYPEEGQKSKGPTPVEALLASIGACSAMDVVAILVKKRQVVTAYRVEVEGVRAPVGEWPRPFLALTVRHILTGKNLEPDAVQRSIELTDEKYCSVIATLREAPKVESVWVIEEA